MTQRRTRIPIVCASLAILLTSLVLSGCGGDDGGININGPSDSDPFAFVSPLTISLAWHSHPDPSVVGYVLHYGRSSPNSAGSCSYESAVFVSSPEVTVTNLHPESRYYFAVSAYNGVESACSAEVSGVTPPLPT
jgi:hypothetical protein